MTEDPQGQPVEAAQTQTPEELADQFKKDELKTAADVVGVDVASRDTKAVIAEKLVAAAPSAQPVQVDGRNRKAGDDGLEGHFVNVVAGEHAGRVGAFIKVLEREADGFPKQILVRTRDEFNQLLSVAYADVKHAGDYHGGR
jgi:hypothetical protein